MKSPVLGSSYVVRSVNAADNRCVNLFPEIIPEGGKEPAYLQRCPGLVLKTTIGTGPIRGLYSLGAYLYVVSGDKLYRLNSDFEISELAQSALLKESGDFVLLESGERILLEAVGTSWIGTISGSGPVSMADNGTQIFIAANPDGYIYNVSTEAFAQITDEDFPGAVTVGYLDGYFVFNEPDSQRVWVTSLLDGTSIDPLDFASAEGSPDGLVSLIIDHREAWLFGTNSVEVWYNSGEADFPLSRIQGAYNEVGCIAPYSVAKMDNRVFWLGADARGQGIVYTAQGYQAVRISTHAVEYAIQQYGNLSDATAYTYQQDGHVFYVLNFTDADTTWVYDAATESWHERAGFRRGKFKRHRADNQARFANAPVVGDYENGRVYQYSLDAYSDAGVTQKWLRSWRALPTGANNLKRSAHHSLQIDCETGVGLPGVDAFDNPTEITTEAEVWVNTESGDPETVGTMGTEVPEDVETETCNNLLAVTEDDGLTLITETSPVVGANPQMILRWSDDGGHTWSGERQASMGRSGSYATRVIYRRLGMTMKLRDRVYEISGTDPVKVAIMGAELEVTGTAA